MTLLERVHLCKEEGCKRTPRTPELGFCDQHQPRWAPAWVERMRRGEAKGKVLA